MQLPTCSNVRIRSTHDAHKIFYAIQRGVLHMVTRRLDAEERLALCSGCVYAWEERGPHTEITGLGIERFTEGRRWSPSRVRDEFLFYYEKYSHPADSGQLNNNSENEPPRDWDPLVKQTYSVWVETERGRRKWHLTAYFTQATVDRLGTIDNIQGVGDLDVPDGRFKSTRVGKNRRGDDTHGRSNDILKPTLTTVTRTYAPFPAVYSSQVLSQSDSQPLLMYEPYQNSKAHSTYDSQSPQYSMPPPLPPNPPTPSHGAYQPHYDAQSRPQPSSSSIHPDYIPQDMYARHPSHGYTSSRAETLPYDGASRIRVDQSSSSSLNSSQNPYHVGIPGTYDPHQSHHGSFYPPLPHSVNHSPLDPGPGWYPPPPMHSAPMGPSGYHSCSDPTPYRSYPSTLGPLPPSYASYSFPDHPPKATINSHSASYSEPIPPSLHPLCSPPNHQNSPQDQGPSSHPTLVLPEPTDSPSGEAVSLSEPSSPDSNESGSVGPCRAGLAPLHKLQRQNHPYNRRDPMDDKALRMFLGRSRPSA